MASSAPASRGVDHERVLVADGFRVAAFADFVIEPAAGVLAARLARQRQAPFAEALFEEGFVERRQIADFANAAGVQVALGDFADAGDLAHVERRQEARLLAGKDPQNAVGLGLIGGDFRDQPRRRGADGAVQSGGLLDALRAACGRPEAAGRAAVPCRSDRDRLRRWTPSRLAARNFCRTS